MMDTARMAELASRAEWEARDDLSEFDRENIGEIIGGHGTWFHAHLLRLCHRADAYNLARLSVAYPRTVAAYLDWRDSPVPWSAP